MSLRQSGLSNKIPIPFRNEVAGVVRGKKGTLGDGGDGARSGFATDLFKYNYVQIKLTLGREVSQETVREHERNLLRFWTRLQCAEKVIKCAVVISNCIAIQETSLIEGA